MSIRVKIFEAIEEHGKPMTMQQIYDALPNEKKHTIRARIYCNLVDGTKVSKAGKNQFIKVAKGTYDINREEK